MSEAKSCLPARDGPNASHFCHGPHIMNEFWLGPPDGNASDLSGWSRPFRTPAPQPATGNAMGSAVGMMAQPVTTETQHIWIDQDGAYALPLYRLAGLYSAANAEFSTRPFPMPDEAAGERLYVNADVSWGPSRGQGGVGCDEPCSAYLMAELLDASTGRALRHKEDCALQNVDGLEIELRWRSGGGGGGEAAAAAVAVVAPKTAVRLRFYLREATVYAFGISSRGAVAVAAAAAAE